MVLTPCSYAISTTLGKHIRYFVCFSFDDIAFYYCTITGYGQATANDMCVRKLLLFFRPPTNTHG